MKPPGNSTEGRGPRARRQWVNAALRAGVNSIEHGTFTNAETFKLYRQTGAYYVPTLIDPAAALADGQRGALTPAQYEKARLAAGNAEKSFAEAIRQNVKIAFGTDTGVSPHGRNAEEFALMVRNGMAPAAAIRSATVDAAELLGRSATIGTIVAGKDADIIAVRGDPTTDVRLLEKVDFVMKHGRVHKLGGARQLTSSDELSLPSREGSRGGCARLRALKLRRLRRARSLATHPLPSLKGRGDYPRLRRSIVAPTALNFSSSRS